MHCALVRFVHEWMVQALEYGSYLIEGRCLLQRQLKVERFCGDKIQQMRMLTYVFGRL